MKSNVTISIALFIIFTASSAQGQEYPKPNFNIAGGVGFNMGNTSDFVDTSGVFVAGGGYDFSSRFGVSGEYQFYNLKFKDDVIVAANDPDASGQLDSLTGNAQWRFANSSVVGAYAIGGGGWYRRTVKSQTTVIAPGTVCSGFWVWWGVECVTGLVPTTITLAEFKNNAFGLNGGAGVTFKLTPGGLKFYTELRYHFAFNKFQDTEVLPLTFGVRW